MKPTIALLLTLFVISLAVSPCLEAAGELPPSLFVNGKKIETAPLDKSGILYVPAQSVSSALGLILKWDPSSQTIAIKDKSVQVAPLMKGGVLFVPAESMAEVAGASLEWDPVAKKASFVYPPPKIRPKNPETPPGIGTPPKFVPDKGAIVKNPQNPRLPENPVPQIQEPEIFIPRSASNGDFFITVTNVERVTVIKDFYRPKPGYRFVIIHLSQQNVSDKVQMYTGRFSLVDAAGRAFDYVEGLSNFWLQILRPGGINFGYLVFEIPDKSSPVQLILHTYNTSPLAVNLQ
ncbi:MAG: DUF4352 domain-containing protein [Armatimonadetes bacterium]|nr:DUF4352 domain-containing protein [Armatimonadota bacterium]